VLASGREGGLEASVERSGRAEGAISGSEEGATAIDARTGRQIPSYISELLHQCETAAADLPFCEVGEGAADEASGLTGAPFSKASSISFLCNPFGRFSVASAEARLLSSFEGFLVDPFVARSIW
jgi:hypothetical protein